MSEVISPGDFARNTRGFGPAIRNRILVLNRIFLIVSPDSSAGMTQNHSRQENFR